ncbi:hypothetical protein [Micromonospora sp. RTP1Z1]|uniref:hypothetical protein n=1 Tax=Micromonospora sp. RTP1Z1 TaxID=2994043 RepID=UPI0029C92756|nr:hypothetical protein [Micromonospora sp. RTP1Z1]
MALDLADTSAERWEAWLPTEPEQGSRWWYGHDLLVRDDGGWLSAWARTPEAWEVLRELLPGDWMEE